VNAAIGEQTDELRRRGAIRRNERNESVSVGRQRRNAFDCAVTEQRGVQKGYAALPGIDGCVQLGPAFYDLAATRANERSRRDTLHPGRDWATHECSKSNRHSVQQIKASVVKYFELCPPKHL
jgi:hypothetical protein